MPCLVPGLHAQRLRAVERRHLHLGAVSASGIVSGTSTSRLSPLRVNTRRGRDAHDQIEVARRAAAAPGLALAGEAHAAAVANAGGDVHAHALDRAHGSGAATRRAGVIDDRARAAALRAGLGDREHALPLDLDPASLTAGADLRGGARLGAGAVTGRTGGAHGHRKRDLRAGDRLLEGDRDLRLQVSAALGARLRPAPPACARAARPNRLDRMSPIYDASKSKLPKPPKPPPGPPPVENEPVPLSYCLRFSGSPSTS